MEAYIVGGAVRDRLLGLATQDRDWVVVGATPEQLTALGYRSVGTDFPVFLHPETREEHALARTERKTAPGYRGFVVHAAPDVTLEEDLQRRDLTINAMARGEDGVLVDPHGGAGDLAAGVLRHVSPAFAEDPLRVLRVARFAARFDFAVAPETEALMRIIVASGELATLAPERVWQECAKGLLEAQPSRMLAVLRTCGALDALLPEIAALFGVPQPAAQHPEIDAGVHLALALDWAAARGYTLPARYAVLAMNLGRAQPPSTNPSRLHARAQRGVRLAERMSERLRVPADCRDAARLAARWHRVVHRTTELRPATLLDLLHATDALRRPDRLGRLLDASAADVCSCFGAAQDYPPAGIMRAALAVVKKIDAGAIARAVAGARSAKQRYDAIATAVRAARLQALRQWRRANARTNVAS